MKLTLKLISVTVLCIIVLIGVDGYFNVRNEEEYFSNHTNDELVASGRIVAKLVANDWQPNGEQHHAAVFVGGIQEDASPIKIDWVDVDDLAALETSGDPDAHDIRADLRHDEPVTFKRSGFGRAGLLEAYVPVFVQGALVGAVKLSESLDVIGDFNRRTLLGALRLSTGVVLLGAVLAVLFGIRMIGSPLERLMDKARRVGAGDLSGSLHIRGASELSELAEAMNVMCQNLERAQVRVREETEAKLAALEQLRHADRLKTIGRLASGVAHELGTPLNVIAGRAALIGSGALTNEERVKSADTIREQAERMTHIIRQLLDFSRARRPQKEMYDLHGLAEQTIELMAPLARKQEVEVHLDGAAGPVQAEVDPSQVQQVLTNLIMNAIQAVPERGDVNVVVDTTHAVPPAGHDGKEGLYARIAVEDTGKGIAEEDIRHIFDPFYTTKEVGEGSGLGLSIAYGLVREHGGWIEVQSEQDKGSQFSVYIPMRE